MLKRVRGESAEIRIKDASFPVPFAHSLEYNAPAHGTWNIVHIAMTVPESYSVYVCPLNCMRGVAMTAAEMGCLDRFASVTIAERDADMGSVEDLTVDGVSDVLSHLRKKPPVVFVFLVCLHIFTSADEDYIFRALAARHPGVQFVKAYMDCIRQKEGPTPDMKLRQAMFSVIRPAEPDPNRVNILGGDVPYAKGSELISLSQGNLPTGGIEPEAGQPHEGQLSGERSSDDLTGRSQKKSGPWSGDKRGAGLTDKRVRQLSDVSTFQEFASLGDAALTICTYPVANDAVRDLAGRLKCRYLYLPPELEFGRIKEEEALLLNTVREIQSEGTQTASSETQTRSSEAQTKRGGAETGDGFDRWCCEMESRCSERLERLQKTLTGCLVAIDAAAHPRPLGLARLLLDHGVKVSCVYLDQILEEEKDSFEYLRARYPFLLLRPTMRFEMIRREETPGDESQRVIALGQKAAWFEGTPFFVNMIEGGGLWGYSGILSLCDLIEEAAGEEKDLREIIPRKGMGWPSLCCVPGIQSQSR